MHLNCAMKFFENLQLAGQSFLSIFLDPHDRQQGVLHLGQDVDPGVLPQEDVVLEIDGALLTWHGKSSRSVTDRPESRRHTRQDVVQEMEGK